MTYKLRTAGFLAGFLVLAGFSISVFADRLSLPVGGYGRVLGLQEYPLTSFTLSGWVNVTHFPEGVAPFLTYLSKDVDSQMSFFLRPDGVGILWGGPTPTPEGNIVGDIPITQRRPRAYTPKQERSKREVDYSGGLGDVENILTRRSGFTDNSWAPMNFVDVAQMGVDDLMTSGSENADLYAEDRSPHAQVYSQWTNVPYELHMQESEAEENYAPHQTVVPPPPQAVAPAPHQTVVPAPKNPKLEPRIITQPSGDDDFVFFNWNVPAGNQGNQIPLGSNNWSPVWESVRENPETNVVQQGDRITFEEPQQKTIKAVFASPPEVTHEATNNVWVTPDQNQGVDLTNKWDPVGLNADIYEHRPVETKLLPTKFLRPVWPDVQPPPAPRNDSPIRGDVTTTPVPKTTTTSTTTTTTTATTTTTTTTPTPTSTTKLPRRNIIPALYRYTKKQKQNPTIPTAVKEIPQSPKLALPSTFELPPKIALSSKFAVPPKHSLPSNSALPPKLVLPSKPSRARIPLWKLIKKPLNNGQKPLISTTTKRTIAKTVPKKDFIFTNPAILTTTEKSLSETTKLPFPEPTLPPFKPSDNEEILQMLGSQKRNVFLRSRPLQSPSIARRPTPQVRLTTTTSPLTTSRRIPFRPTPITHKVPNYQGSSLRGNSHYSLPKKADKDSDKRIEPSHFFLPKDQDKLNRNTDSNHYSQPKISDKFNVKRTESRQTIYKPNYSKYGFTKTNEFEKAMQNPKLVKEGNTAVVYAVPITNEKEFYEMYKKYQKESKAAMNLHELYNEMRTSGTEDTEEEEVNHNRISPDLSLYKTRFYDKRTQRVTTSVPTVEIKPATTEFKLTTTTTQLPNNIEHVKEENLENKVSSLKEVKSEKETKEADVNVHESESYPLYEENEFADYIDDNYYDYYETGVRNENDEESTSYYDTNVASEDYPTNYYIPEREKPQTTEQLTDLYRPKTANEAQTPQASPAHYQEPQRLFHEQLPPQYQKPQKSQNNFNGPKIQTQQYPAANQNSFQAYRPDPFEIISQGLIPEPIHRVDDQKAIKRMDDNVQESQRIDQPTLIVPPHLIPAAFPPPKIQNTIPVPGLTQTQNSNGLTSEKVPLDIHFEKLPYEFVENAWYHLTFTWDSETKRASVYVNGEIVGEIENVLANKPHLEAEGLFLLGKTLLPDLSDFDESSQFVGEMSDVNMWATELPPQTVDAVFQCKYIPISSQPIDWDSTELKLYDSASMTPSPPLCGLVT